MRGPEKSGSSLGNRTVNKLKVFSGRANIALAEKMAAVLGDPLGKITISNFPDGEISIRIEEDVPRPRHFSRAADLSARQRKSDGVVDSSR